MLDMDQINRQTWRARSSLRLYAKLDGCFDAGEQVALDVIETDIRDKRVLDLGVGGGRTAGLLGPIASEYIGIDYTPEMVSICKERYPDLTFYEADARDLSRFADHTFDCVVFSCNAIDSVDATGRTRILNECVRVLVPGGVLLYSTFNRDGPGFRDRAINRQVEISGNPVRVGYSLAKYVVGGVLGWQRILRRASLEREAGDHSILLHKAHDFGILVYASTLKSIRAEVVASGLLAGPRLFGVSGIEILDDRADDEEYVHVVARKPIVGNAAI